MLFEQIRAGKFHLIKFTEILHLTSDISDIITLVKKLVTEGERYLAIEFVNDSYLCSRTGADLIKCWEYIEGSGGQLVLVNVNHDIQDFLAVIDMHARIKVFNTKEELAKID